MMKRWIALLFIVAGYQMELNAQNELIISSIRSPQFEFNYKADDSINVEVVMKNNGPNIIFGTDQIHFDVKLSNSDTSIFYAVSRFPFSNMAINDAQIFTLVQDIKFNAESNYQVCVSVSGTDQYPSNTSKDPGPCISFVVGIDEKMVKENKVFFQNGQMNFELNNPTSDLQYRIIDLSGKILKNGNLNRQREQAVRFSPPARGLYFLQLLSAIGQQSTYKFIVR